MFLATACAAALPQGDDYHPPHEHGEITVPEPVALECSGALTQGGAALCKTNPGAELRVNGQSVGFADADGEITISFGRDAPAETRVEAHRNGISTFVDLRIEGR